MEPGQSRCLLGSTGVLVGSYRRPAAAPSLPIDLIQSCAKTPTAEKTSEQMTQPRKMGSISCSRPLISPVKGIER